MKQFPYVFLVLLTLGGLLNGLSAQIMYQEVDNKKFGIYPTFVPTGERSVWARPHLRFDFSVARYNDYAKENLYSPYLSYVGPKQWGYYFGVKAEWWIWN